MGLEEYKSIIHRCFKCGYCKFTYDCSYLGFNCPLYNKNCFETYSPGGLMWLIYASLVKKEIEWSEYSTNILYSCTMCMNCVQQCRFKFNEDLVNILKAAREKLVNTGVIPKIVSQFLTNVYNYGNPYKELKENRGDWAKGTKIKQYEKGNEFLYYVGCVGSYDTVSKKAAKALGEVLSESGISFGILGNRENCDGNEVDMLGEKGLFEWLRDRNIQIFKDLGVKKIITLSPHSYNALKNNYSNEFEVFHYTQVLRDLIKDRDLKFFKELNAKVTYHDPCFLGRYNREYDAPREILNSIPGIELVEMSRNRENAFCCGGGGGNFYTDLLGGGKNQPSVIRVEEAYNTGADILAVACPICVTMLEDGIKTAGLEKKLVVKDISEIVKESL
jgi:Fe-S oxidoreductase